jgi:hypothetical protein
MMHKLRVSRNDFDREWERDLSSSSAVPAAPVFAQLRRSILTTACEISRRSHVCKPKMGSCRSRPHWSRLTVGDWRPVTGKKAQAVWCIQERYAFPREAPERQADEWSNALLDTAEPT